MVPHLLPHPPHIHIPKYISAYTSPHLLSRPKLSSPSYFADIPHLVSSSISPVESASPATVDDDISSPHSPLGNSANYHYANRTSASFDSPISPPKMYGHSQQSADYPAAPNSYPPPTSQDNYEISSTTNLMRGSDAPPPYLANSPSPVDPNPPSSFSHPLGASHPQERLSQATFPTSSSYQSAQDRFDESSDAIQHRYPRSTLENKYSSDTNSYSQNNNLLDHRRMSEPAILGSTNVYAAQSQDPGVSQRLQQFNFNPPAMNPPRSSGSAYVPSLQRGASIGSLRDLRNFEYSSQSQSNYSGWKSDNESHRQSHLDPYHGDDGFDDQISPLQPNFSEGLDSPGLHYSSMTDNHYGPSPPGTGTSTSSAPIMSPALDVGHSPRDANSRTYSFVALPGNAVKKRPRRRYDEIERLYQCSWPECNKAYGTLNHLNAHVTMQRHGVKRSPNEFKELRKQWRKAKKDSESPVGGALRRPSLSQRHDGHDTYAHRRYDSNIYSNSPVYNRAPHHQITGLPSSLPVLHASSGERYAVPVDDIRYPLDERDDHFTTYPTAARQRYSSSTPASWHSGSVPSSRTGPQQYLSSSLPTHSHLHNNHLPHPNTEQTQSQSQSPGSQSPPLVVMNRLPPDSTLLTPLPGYQAEPLLPPLQLNGNINYPQSGFEIYEDDGRPSTGHTSVGQGSGDEY
ncbi:hypothetical protein BDZ94DRAFT_1196519 [Collybia nuda]|uniref:C2H2-type domain-containing protein n=1 Tax=Collybia nuda TaxID=64659 RepID=A0A9P5Y4L2_9AGAR|nr:hypothetical protein BDZ94DRAFT_1196519 [Collybia nuda]